MIRRGELVNGTGGFGTGIRHALQGAVPPFGMNRNAPGGRTWVWPASSSDPPSTYDVVGNVYMGSLLAIPPGVNINTLGITDSQALEVARALQDYGLYIVDRAGIPANKIVIRIDPQAATDIGNRTAFEAGINLAMRQLQVVTNSHTSGGAPTTPGGGGTPRRPLASSFTAPGSSRVNPIGLILTAAVTGRSPLSINRFLDILPITAVAMALLPRNRVNRRWPSNAPSGK
jgi:hypothetical protein